MKIICPGGYTWLNKGDAALVLSMLAELRRVAPEAQRVVLSDTPSLDARMYGETVLPPLYGGTLEPPVRPAAVGTLQRWSQGLRRTWHRHLGWRLDGWLDRPGRSSRYSRRELIDLWSDWLAFHANMAWLYLVIRLAGRRSHVLVPGQQGRVLREFCEADAAVFVPGGYFIAPHAAHRHWLRHVAAALVARWLGLPTHFFACTIGPFHGRHNAWLARRALNHPHRIYVREQSSYAALARIAPRSRHAMTGDAGFLLPSCPAQQVEALSQRLLAHDHRPALGVSVRDYGFPGHPDPSAQRRHYLDAVAKAIEHAVRHLGMTVYLVPQVLADEVNDLSVAREVLALLGDTGHVHLIDQDLDPRELKGLYGRFDLFMGVRMHANIFALSSGVPTVAIAYEPKTEGIMQQLGLGEFAISIRRLDAPTLITLLERLHAQAPAVRQQLAQAIPAIQTAARQTADDLRDELCR